jgi:hypothetical protein
VKENRKSEGQEKAKPKQKKNQTDGKKLKHGYGGNRIRIGQKNRCGNE